MRTRTGLAPHAAESPRPVGRDRDYGGHDPRVGDLRRRGVHPARRSARVARAPVVARGRLDRDRGLAHVCRARCDVSIVRRPVRLHQAGVRPSVGLSVRVDIVVRDSIGRQCISRRRLWRVPWRVCPILFIDARDRLDFARAMAVAAEHGATGGRGGDCRVVDVELLRHEVRVQRAGHLDRHQGVVGRGAHWIRLAGAGEGASHLDRSTTADQPCDRRGCRHRRDHRQLRRLVPSHVLRGRHQTGRSGTCRSG